MNYEKIKNKTYAKIQQYGSDCMIIRAIEEIYNPVTNEYEGGKEFVHGSALQSNFDIKNIDGTNIQAGDIRLMCVLESKPVVGDTLEFAGTEYKIVNFNVFAPDGITVMYYDIQCR